MRGLLWSTILNPYCGISINPVLYGKPRAKLWQISFVERSDTPLQANNVILPAYLRAPDAA
jgi:hypothetical protein